MNQKQSLVLLSSIVIALSSLFFSSCKSCNKDRLPNTTSNDSLAVQPATPPVNSINLPHADTSLIPELTKTLEQAFDASAKKDYSKLASLIVYRGIDSTRFGYDVFNVQSNYERNVIRITAGVLNKWNGSAETKDYGRVFDLTLPDGRQMPMLEVIFVSKKSIDRKFFGFLKIKNSYRIGDVTSNLGMPGD